jgi:UDPglucose--hexose-1-phosphate uridylyltransferase
VRPGGAPLPAGPHRRYNPLLDEWVLCSPQRLERPWQGQREVVPAEALPARDPACYLCPGSMRAGGVRNPDYAGTFAFDNDFPALTPGGDAGALEADAAELLLARPEAGACRVLCYAPRHDASLATLGASEVRGVVDCWADESARLRRLDFVGHVQVFENRGAAMGCSNHHPHGQVWATRHVPSLAARRIASQRAYFDSHGRDLLGACLEREIEAGVRIVTANPHWVALVPFWAVWPFETMLVPRRRVGELAQLAPSERDALALLLGDLHRRFDALFACPFPYSMAWHEQAPGDAGECVRLHASYFPPLLRSASVRKFLVGYELAAEPQRDVTPEAAAERLRAVAPGP